MSNTVEDIKEYWAENKLCFSDFNKTEAMDLLKIMILKEIDLRWEAGFVHLAKVELLTKAFPDDILLFEIYNQLLRKCNDIVINLGESNYRDVMERCFSGEPMTYLNEDGLMTRYNVNDNKYLKKIIADHPEAEGAINGVIYR